MQVLKAPVTAFVSMSRVVAIFTAAT